MIPQGIKIIDNLIENNQEIVEYLQKQSLWKKSEVTNKNSSEKVRTSETLFIPMMAWTNPTIIHEMNKKVWQAIDNYAKEYDFSFSYIEDVSVQRYIGDAHYDAHIDSGPNIPRIVSAVLYLNTVEKGGETRFTLFNYSVKPVAGRLAIFPSNYIYKHEALPPKKGIKIAAAYWARQ